MFTISTSASQWSQYSPLTTFRCATALMLTRCLQLSGSWFPPHLQDLEQVCVRTVYLLV